MPRVFLVEDHAPVVRLVKDLVETEGWEFESVLQCRGAVAAIRKFQPDALLLDVALPDGDGFEICRQVKAESSLYKIPIIFLTAKGDIASRLKGFECGANDYVPKPFDIRELRARLYAHLSMKQEKDSFLKERERFIVHERVQQELLDTVVHDLRAPLTTIKVTLEWVRASGVISNAEFEMLIESAEQAADWALFMVNDMLDLSSGKLTIKTDLLDIDRLFRKLDSLFGVQARSRKSMLVFERDAHPPRIKTDAIVVLRIVGNLVSNALKFAPCGAPIRIAARGAEEKIRFEVDDEGPGVPDAEKEKIFLKHYRFEKPGSHPTQAGSGIGLAFGRMAAEALRGRIWVEDRKPVGSRFVLELPVS